MKIESVGSTEDFNLSQSEIELVNRILTSHKTKFIDIISSYFKTVSDVNDTFERLENIFTRYYNVLSSPYEPTVAIYFSDKVKKASDDFLTELHVFRKNRQGNKKQTLEKTEISTKTIAYMLKFYKDSHDLGENNEQLYEMFSERFGSTPGSIKKVFSDINREKDSKVFHVANIKYIKEAIETIGDRKSKDAGRKFKKNLSI